MIIYKFNTWFTKDKPYSITEVEVEEKPKSYVGKGVRINKSDLDIVKPAYGQMYSLSNDPSLYIEKMIALSEKRVLAANNKLTIAKTNLEIWKRERRRNGF